MSLKGKELWKEVLPSSPTCYFQLIYLQYFQPDSVLQKVIARDSSAVAANLFVQW